MPAQSSPDPQEPADPPRRRAWHILTGDYPPTPGGVADYTSLLARALVAAGQEVHVWSRGDAAPILEPGEVHVHRSAGRFGPTDLARIGRELNQFTAPRTILVQYVPHAYGARAMNLPFVLWLAGRARGGDEVRVMFHEVAYPWCRRPLRHNLLAATNRLMAAILVRASTRVYVSIPSWEPLLRRLGATRTPIIWTPVPSNIPAASAVDPDANHPAGRDGGNPSRLVVGHFGTYSSPITRRLAPILRELLHRRSEVRVSLIGSGSLDWRAEFLAEHPVWADRVVATGAQDGPTVRDHLRSCACLIQPYPDGVSTRRGTIMAALANGIPVVTNLGPLSESLWTAGPVVTGSVANVPQMVDLVNELLDSPDRRLELSQAGRQLYDSRFAISLTVATLLESIAHPGSVASSRGPNPP